KPPATPVGNVRTFSPVRRSQTIMTQLSRDSLTAVTTSALSGEKAIWLNALYSSVPGDSSRRTSAPVLASQIRAVPSPEAVAIAAPSGEYATEVTRPVWPRSERTGFGVSSAGVFAGGAPAGGGSDPGLPVAAR